MVISLTLGSNRGQGMSNHRRISIGTENPRDRESKFDCGKRHPDVQGPETKSCPGRQRRHVIRGNMSRIDDCCYLCQVFDLVFKLTSVAYSRLLIRLQNYNLILKTIIGTCPGCFLGIEKFPQNLTSYEEGMIQVLSNPFFNRFVYIIRKFELFSLFFSSSVTVFFFTWGYESSAKCA